MHISCAFAYIQRKYKVYNAITPGNSVLWDLSYGLYLKERLCTKDIRMKKTKIIIVRHGESVGNATRVMLGHTDLDLSEHGYKQAECTAKHLENEKIDAIYSSDLMRAYNTAVPHATRRGMEIRRERGFRELCVGDWEGKSVAEIIDKWGDMFKKEWHESFGTFKFPGGEGVMDGGRRFYDAVIKVARGHEGQTVMICAHAAVIRSFWSIISEIEPEKIVDELPFPTNASYSVAYFDGERIAPAEYSCDEHLAELGITRVLT